MATYYIELTDLFCGELNYSFVNRFIVKSVSIRGAVSKLSRHIGLNFNIYYGDSMSAIYHSRSKLSGVFIEGIDLNDAGHISASCYCEEL